MKTVPLMHGGSVGVLTGSARTEADLGVAIVVISAILLLVHFVRGIAFKRRRARGAAQFDSNASHVSSHSGSPTPAMRPVPAPMDYAHNPVAPSFAATRRESTFHQRHTRSAQAAPPAGSRTTPRPMASSTRPASPPPRHAPLRSPPPGPAVVPSLQPPGTNPPGLPMLPPLPPGPDGG